MQNSDGISLPVMSNTQILNREFYSFDLATVAPHIKGVMSQFSLCRISLHDPQFNDIQAKQESGKMVV